MMTSELFLLILGLRFTTSQFRRAMKVFRKLLVVSFKGRSALTLWGAVTVTYVYPFFLWWEWRLTQLDLLHPRPSPFTASSVRPTRMRSALHNRLAH